MLRWIRPLLASVANSNKVISEIAKPSAFLRALSIAVLAFLEIRSWSNASQTTTCVSTRIT